MKFWDVAVNFIANFILGVAAGVAALAFNAFINYAAGNGMNGVILAVIWGYGMVLLFEAYRWAKNKWVLFYKWVYTPSVYQQKTEPIDNDNSRSWSVVASGFLKKIHSSIRSLRRSVIRARFR